MEIRLSNDAAERLYRAQGAGDFFDLGAVMRRRTSIGVWFASFIRVKFARFA